MGHWNTPPHGLKSSIDSKLCLPPILTPQPAALEWLSSLKQKESIPLRRNAWPYPNLHFFGVSQGLVLENSGRSKHLEAGSIKRRTLPNLALPSAAT